VVVAAAADPAVGVGSLLPYAPPPMGAAAATGDAASGDAATGATAVGDAAVGDVAGTGAAAVDAVAAGVAVTVTCW
jgi:hypothetical protein